jgi:uncharacterized protein DUF6515
MIQNCFDRKWRSVGLVVCVCGLVSFSAPAQWGSIRGNNHGEREIHGAAQGATRVVPERRPAFEEHRVLPQTGRRDEHERREVEPERRWGERSREARHFDFDEDRRHGFFWSHIPRGAFYASLPTGYVPLSVGGNPYYYYEGAYYQPQASGYVAVTPPIGAVVPQLPPGAEPVTLGQATYYYVDGAFYLPQAQGLVVVPPPLGVTVSSLPPGATPVYIRGGLYYQANGVYYMPSIQGGGTVYTTVQP